MTGIIPITADQPNRNPQQQQHDNDRSTSALQWTGGYPFDMHVVEPS